MNCRIIFAEDQQLIRESVHLLLDGDPELSILDTAADGREALELCRAKRPDIILMDVRMPVMDGREARLQIRNAE
nr:response regulator transcription factor [Spirochaetales bacterium]